MVSVLALVISYVPLIQNQYAIVVYFGAAYAERHHLH